MLDRNRWIVECRMMQKWFPGFRAEAENGTVGFKGDLRGPRSGRIYEVMLVAHRFSYPEGPPAVYINPRPEHHHWLAGGQLCVQRPWVPAKSTFANTLLVAAKYIHEFDRR